MTSTKNKLREFILEEFDGAVSPAELTDGFVLGQAIDSIGLFQLVSFIEEEFDVEVRNSEIVPEYFDTIDGMARLVQSKRPQS
jgi:acyl carrier protein